MYEEQSLNIVSATTIKGRSQTVDEETKESELTEKIKRKKILFP